MRRVALVGNAGEASDIWVFVFIFAHRLKRLLFGCEPFLPPIETEKKVGSPSLRPHWPEKTVFPTQIS